MLFYRFLKYNEEIMLELKFNLKLIKSVLSYIFMFYWKQKRMERNFSRIIINSTVISRFIFFFHLFIYLFPTSYLLLSLPLKISPFKNIRIFVHLNSRLSLLERIKHVIKKCVKNVIKHFPRFLLHFLVEILKSVFF